MHSTRPLSIHSLLLLLSSLCLFIEQAEGEAAQIEIRAKAHAKAIETVAAALQGPLGSDAAKLHVAREVR
jgi:hypothetical protein